MTRRILIFVGLLSISISVNAAPLTWTLNNAVLADGGVVNGSFIYDADTEVFTDMNITTSGGNTLIFPGETYTFGVDNGFGGVVGLTVSTGSDLTGTSSLGFGLYENMTNAGGTIGIYIPTAELDYGAEVQCGDFACNGTNIVAARRFTSGSISAVPLPTTTLYIDGIFYKLTTIIGSYNELSGTLVSQPWWGLDNPADGTNFSTLTNTALGNPNDNGSSAPYFAVWTDPGVIYYYVWQWGAGFSFFDLSNDLDEIKTWAVVNTDFDDDGVPDTVDNCPAIPNPGQENTNGGPRGDACNILPPGC